MARYNTLRYRVKDRIARITLNRPERLNAINDEMPGEIRCAAAGGREMVVNQAIDKVGLEQTQMLATLLDGVTRHSPEGLWFKRYAETFGFKAAVEWRDSGQPLPEPGPGNLGDAFMTPPAKGSRSKWSRDGSGKRTGRIVSTKT